MTITLLAILSLLIQTPVWLLMFFAPNHALTKRITSNYWVLIVLGALYIVFAIGVIAYTFSLSSIVNSAMAAVPADAKDINAESMKPILDALNKMASVPTVLWSLLLATAWLDIAVGYLAFQATQRFGTRRVNASALLLIMFLLGPIGALIFGLWYQLNPAHARTVADSGEPTPQ